MPEKTRTPRKCPYCKAVFSPVIRGGPEQRFCCPAHRKAYHQYGALPFQKLMDGIRKEVREIVRIEVELQLQSRYGDDRIRNIAGLFAPEVIKPVVRQVVAEVMASGSDGAGAYSPASSR